MNILQRAAAPTPSFFKKLQLFGLMLLAASGAIIGGGGNLPHALSEIAKYVATAGGVMISVSQVTVDDEKISAQTPAEKSKK